MNYDTLVINCGNKIIRENLLSIWKMKFKERSSIYIYWTEIWDHDIKKCVLTDFERFLPCFRCSYKGMFIHVLILCRFIFEPLYFNFFHAFYVFKCNLKYSNDVMYSQLNKTKNDLHSLYLFALVILVF